MLVLDFNGQNGVVCQRCRLFKKSVNVMTLNNSRKALIDKRRQYVASLRLQGKTQREIEAELPGLGVINPKTSKGFTLAIINSDLKAIREEWRAEAVQDIAEHVARVLAELREVKRAAWSEKAFGDILRAIEKECKILGIDSPDKQIVVEATVEQVIGLLPETWQKEIRDAIAAASG